MALVNVNEIKDKCTKLEEYILNLHIDGVPAILSGRKTGFISLIICLNNIVDYFIFCSENVQLQYLLTYKLLQDFIENFFCAVRYKSGHNNNPTALQFEGIFKRLLIRHELKSVENANCEPDGVPILNVTTFKKIKEEIDEEIEIPEIGTLNELSQFVNDVSEYIAGFVVKSVLKKNCCDICCGH